MVAHESKRWRLIHYTVTVTLCNHVTVLSVKQLFTMCFYYLHTNSNKVMVREMVSSQSHIVCILSVYFYFCHWKLLHVTKVYKWACFKNFKFVCVAMYFLNNKSLHLSSLNLRYWNSTSSTIKIECRMILILFHMWNHSDGYDNRITLHSF